VIEGFHGVRYDAPLGRTREIIEICRKVWTRERVVHDGRYYQLPLPADQGTGLAKPLKIIAKPVRDRIPIWVASLGPKNVELTAEVADGWLPIFYLPERARDVWGADLTVVEREFTLVGVNPALDAFTDLASQLHSGARDSAREVGKALAVA
jgi:alkanesulfonate monooxygenase SsuD/methylene tetrahydromethanopterin reductase-like flavin-dependent oxidoreductase (luciferase family)